MLGSTYIKVNGTYLKTKYILIFQQRIFFEQLQGMDSMASNATIMSSSIPQLAKEFIEMEPTIQDLELEMMKLCT